MPVGVHGQTGDLVEVDMIPESSPIDTAVDIDQLQARLEAESQTRQQRGGGGLSADDELSGDIAAPTTGSKQPQIDRQFDTLDEPVWDTVKRDLLAVGFKFGHVLYPKRNQALLRDWDLWGPLFLCVFISLLLHGGGGGRGPQFTEVFVLTFFGACVVTLNIQLLGGTISFFQTLCVLGYCLLAPAAAALACQVILFSGSASTLIFVVRLLVTAAGFLWATYASTSFLAATQPPKRKALAIYPIFLFYLVISWMIVSHS